MEYQPVRNDSIQKIVKDQEDDNTTGYLLENNYFKICYKLTAID